MKRFLAALILALGVAAIGVPAGAQSTASPSASPSAAPTATPNAEVMTRAKDWFARIATGKIDRKQLTKEMNAALTDSTLKALAAQIAPLGKPATFEQIQAGSMNGFQYCVYAVTFASGDKLDYIFSYDASSGLIGGLRLTPAQ